MSKRKNLRNETILALRTKGKTLGEIANMYGLNRQRVLQIIYSEIERNKKESRKPTKRVEK